MSEFRALRQKMSMTQGELARTLEVSLSTVQRWERQPSRVAMLALFAVYQHWRKENAPVANHA